MTNQEIFELIDRFERSGLGKMKLSMQDFSLELSRRGPDAGGGRAAAVSKTAEVVDSGEKAEPEEQTGFFITAPMVGTYYAASAPRQSPFVMPGDRVYKGQTVCMMEAMKMISEIPAPCDCIIEEILKADGDLAAFGEPLFRYQPC